MRFAIEWTIWKICFELTIAVGCAWAQQFIYGDDQRIQNDEHAMRARAFAANAVWIIIAERWVTLFVTARRGHFHREQTRTTADETNSISM